MGFHTASAAVPVQLHLPPGQQACTATRQCPVALLAPGYGLGGNDYSFITRQLNELRYLVVVFGPELTGNIRFDPNGDQQAQRASLARLGAQNIRLALDQIGPRYPQYDWRHVAAVGHSLGGDSLALLAREEASPVAALVTLDNRRVELPRSSSIKILSIRADDTVADEGVLPTDDEAKRYGICLIRIGGSRHNDMQDEGSPLLKSKISHAIGMFLAPAVQPKYSCDSDSQLD